MPALVRSSSTNSLVRIEKKKKKKKKKKKRERGEKKRSHDNNNALRPCASAYTRMYLSWMSDGSL